MGKKNESQSLFRAIQDKIMIIIGSVNGKNMLNIGFQFFQIFLSSILFIYIYEKKNNYIIFIIYFFLFWILPINLQGIIYLKLLKLRNICKFIIDIKDRKNCKSVGKNFRKSKVF